MCGSMAGGLGGDQCEEKFERIDIEEKREEQRGVDKNCAGIMKPIAPEETIVRPPH